MAGYKLYLSLLLIELLVVFATAGTSSGNIDALYDIYSAANGPDWRWGMLPGIQWVFNSTSDPCADHWQGVTCIGCDSSESYCNVTKLNLPGYNMRGSLSPSLCNLLNLTNVTLSGNHLESTVPSCVLFELQHLKIITISSNNFTGSLPFRNDSSFFQTKLRHLDFSVNHFTGTVPSLFGVLPHLTLLSLTSNRLSGPFPTFIGANLTSLISLEMAANFLTGSISASFWSSVSSLYNLRIGGNPLQGSLASTICSLTGLHHLYLNGSQFTGAIPPCLFRGNLTEIFLDNNKFSGTLPTYMSAPIINLFLQNNQLHGSLPMALGNLPLLAVAVLAVNKFSGPIPVSFENSQLLQVLAVNDNSLSGEIPTAIFSLPIVYVLNFSRNKFNGKNLRICGLSYRLACIYIGVSVSVCRSVTLLCRYTC